MGFFVKKLAYLIFLLYICREFRKEKKTCEKMKAKWTSLVDDLQGSIDKKHYARHIPGNGEWAAVCSKPELSKKTKQKKANLLHVKEFSQLIATCKEILRFNHSYVRLMSGRAYIRHILSIYSAYIGTRWKPRGKEVAL